MRSVDEPLINCFDFGLKGCFWSWICNLVIGLYQNNASWSSKFHYFTKTKHNGVFLLLSFHFDLLLSLHHIPFLAWIVAPLTSSTDSGVPRSSTSNFCNNIASATVDSISANWSPMHFLGPPPNGKNAKSAMICSHQPPQKVTIVLVTKQKRAKDWILQVLDCSSPRWGRVHQGFEMDQSQPSLQYRCSPLFLRTSQAQTLVGYPKSMEIYGDCTPEC